MAKTRSSSLRVAHSRACPNYTRTTLDSVGKGSGCTCKTPSYYTLHRDASGRQVKGPRVRDRREATRALTALQADIDADRLGQRRKAAPTFRQWADDYLEILARDRHNKGSTVRAYGATLSYALPVLGPLSLDVIGQAELRRVVRAIRDAKASDATLHKHLRHLGAILRAAEEEGHIDRSPLARKFVRELRLRVPKGNPPYTDVELAKLWAQMEALDYDPVSLNICKAAVVTGARRGELIAATWSDLSLSAGTLTINHGYDATDGLVAPKDGEPRVVSLIPPAVALFEAWQASQGVQPDAAPVFPAPRTGTWLSGDYLTQLVSNAIEKAGIPKIGEDGRKRKPFHGFRSSYTRLCRERGLDPQWVQGQLGHSDPDLTLNVYGRWSDLAVRAEAQKVERESFPV